MSDRAMPIALLVLLLAACGTPPEPVDLHARERKVFSQHGEDGVIEAIFERIEPTQRYVVEFGAHDGVTNSNARNLILNHGWRALLIEGDPARAAKMKATYRDDPNVTAVEAWVFPGNIEILFEENGVPPDLDLLVIDIDSNDYYVWRAIRDFRPKVVMIEANFAFPPPELMVIDFHPMNYWDQTPYHGASLESLTRLAKRKGYELLHVTSTGPNAFFVDAPYLDRFGLTDNSPEALFPRWAKVRKRPVLIPKGKETLRWKNLVIEKKFLHHR